MSGPEAKDGKTGTHWHSGILRGSLIASVFAIVALLPGGASAKDVPVKVKVARCLVERAPAQMRAWVAADGPMLMWKEGLEARQRTSCTDDINDRGDYWLFRGALAEALLLRDLAPGEEPHWSEVKAPTDLNTALNWKNPLGRRGYLTNVVAECVAQSNVKGTLDLLRADYDSVAEAEAAAGLASDITNCRARAGNFSDKIEPDAFRARLALAAYELNDALHGAASGTGK